MRSEEDIYSAVQQYADTVRRICIIHLKNQADTEDIFQNVFFKYAQNEQEFSSEEHKKAWLIKVTENACKDFLKSFFNQNRVSLDEIKDVVKNNFDKTVEFVDVPDADQYRISLKLREEEHQE